MILGSSVYNRQDEELGFIEELVINRQQGRVVYAVLESGSVAGLGGNWIAVPFGALQHDATNERCILDVSTDRLSTLEGFDEDNWPAAGDPALAPASTRLGNPNDRNAKDTPAAPRSGNRDMTRAGDTSNRAAQDDPGKDRALTADWPSDPEQHWKNRVSELIGLTVKNNDDDTLGELNDIAVDAEHGKIAYGAVEFFEAWYDLNGKLIAVPWAKFSYGSQDEACLVLNALPRQLESAEGFESDDWPDIDDTAWGTRTHEAYGVMPYWVPGYGYGEAALGTPDTRPTTNVETSDDMNQNDRASDDDRSRESTGDNKNVNR